MIEKAGDGIERFHRGERTEKWKTFREAYCSGFNDGIHARSKWVLFTVMMMIMMLLSGFMIGSVI